MYNGYNKGVEPPSVPRVQEVQHLWCGTPKCTPFIPPIHEIRKH